MAPDVGPPTSDGADAALQDSAWPYIGVGCLMLVVGFFGGGMMAMLVGRVTDAITGCRPPAGLPVCTWWRYWWTGAAVGMVALPVAALIRLRRGRRTPSDS